MTVLIEQSLPLTGLLKKCKVPYKEFRTNIGFHYREVTHLGIISTFEICHYVANGKLC